jgi:hypothetical protein
MPWNPSDGAPVARWRRDDGAATAFALIWLPLVLALAATAIDFGNAWSERDGLRRAADAAAHAGAVALARGDGMDEVRDAVAAVVARNAPPARYGRVLADPGRDVVAARHDDRTGLVTDAEVPPGRGGAAGTPPPNAVVVRLERSRRSGNPVPTLLLRLIGIDLVEFESTAVAAIVPTRRCDPASGLFARGPLVQDGALALGPGACLYSHDRLDLRGPGRFAPGSGVGGLRAAACLGDCRDRTASGLADAWFEANLIRPDLGLHLERLVEVFRAGDAAAPEARAFFAARPLARDLSALAEFGIDTKPLRGGSLVTLTPRQFQRLREMPSGLAYAVSCAPEPGRPPPPPHLEITASGDGPMRDLVLITDCPVRIDPWADLRGVVLLATSPAPLAIEGGARAGDPEGGCAPGSHSLLVTAGEAHLPAGFLASNVTVVGAGDITVLPDPPPPPRQAVMLSRGDDDPGPPPPGSGAGAPGRADRGPDRSTEGGTGSLHSDGAIRLIGNLRLGACPGAGPPLLPGLAVIRHLAPDAEAQAEAAARGLADRRAKTVVSDLTRRFEANQPVGLDINRGQNR